MQTLSQCQFNMSGIFGWAAAVAHQIFHINTLLHGDFDD